MRGLAWRWFATPLWRRVIAAMVLGAIAGIVLGPEAESIKWIGDLFIRAIRMLIVPIIFFTLVSGIGSLGDIGLLGRVGGRAVLLFLATSILAITLGIGLGLVVQPGAGLPPMEGVEVQEAPPVRSVSETLLAMVPDNPVAAMAAGDVLPLIVFSVLLGIAMLMAGERAGPVQAVFDAGAVVMQKLTLLVMELTPLGVFALIAWVTGTYGIAAVLPLAKLVGALYAGCFVMLAIYATLVRTIGRVPVATFFRGIAGAQAIAFSTASSSAALPVTLQSVERRLGVSKGVTGFTVSLGATINMDGTALYLGLATLFGAQIFGVELGPQEFLLIVLTSTLGAIGAASIPGTGLIMMTLVLDTVGVPLETIAFVAGVDRIMDMMRTMTNVTGDCAVATMVGRLTGEIGPVAEPRPASA